MPSGRTPAGAAITVSGSPGSPRWLSTRAAPVKSSSAVNALTVTMVVRPAPRAAATPMPESSTTRHVRRVEAEVVEHLQVDVGGRLLARDDVAGEHVAAGRPVRRRRRARARRAPTAPRRWTRRRPSSRWRGRRAISRWMPGRPGSRPASHPFGEQLGLAGVQLLDQVGAFGAVVELAGDALLAAADLQLLGVGGLVPVDRQVELGEGLVEGGQVAVLLGVGQHTVAVEDERRHVRPCRRCRRRRRSAWSCRGRRRRRR